MTELKIKIGGGQLLHRSKLNSCFLFLLLSVFFSSCDFHLVKNPGPQISWSIKQAKENNTFIGAYKAKDRLLDSISIEVVFAEKKYSSDGGLFSKFDIDCCKSQLVIVTDNYLASEGKGFSVDWTISDFSLYSSNIIYKDYDKGSFPDSIPISVVSLKNKRVLQRLTLYKEK